MNPVSVVTCFSSLTLYHIALKWSEKKTQYGVHYNGSEWLERYRTKNLIFLFLNIKHCHLPINFVCSCVNKKKTSGGWKIRARKWNLFRWHINYASFCRLFWLIIILSVLYSSRGKGNWGVWGRKPEEKKNLKLI